MLVCIDFNFGPEVVEQNGKLCCRSKSVGNFFTIRDVLKKYHGMAMRWFLVGTQYRQPMNYSQVALEEASARLYYLVETLAESRKMINESGTPPECSS